MSAGARRIFWGQSLPQALARAALHYQIPLERLAYRIHEKRRGFVRHPRAVLIEVDPMAPEQTILAPLAATVAPSVTPAPAAAPPRLPSARRHEPWASPDDDSELAAREAMLRLLRFSGLEAEAGARRGDGRIEIEVATNSATLLTIELVDEIEQLLQSAVAGLSGRRVRCRVDVNGVRAAHEASLGAWAREAAERVRRSGAEESTQPMAAAERRLVHLALAGDPELATESRGDGELKSVRIFRTDAATTRSTDQRVS